MALPVLLPRRECEMAAFDEVNSPLAADLRPP